MPSRCPGWRDRARRVTPRKVQPMSIFKKFAHKTEAVKGSTKKTFGHATGSERMEAEGRGDQVKGDTKMAGAKIKDAFKKERSPALLLAQRRSASGTPLISSASSPSS